MSSMDSGRFLHDHADGYLKHLRLSSFGFVDITLNMGHIYQ